MPNTSLPSFILGTMRWGVWGANLSVAAAAELLRSSVSMGITTFDLADIYGDYTTEALFGAALKASGVARDEVQIISKCAIVLPSTLRVKHYNTSRDYILASVERSLAQIGTDYLDTLLIHRPSPLMDLHEIAETFHQLQESGQVKQFSVSNFDAYAFEQLNALFPLMTNQLELSLNQPQALFDNTLLQLRTLHKSIQVWSPLGSYFSDSSSTQNHRIRSVLIRLCEKYQADESQMLIAWAQYRQPNAAVILGSSNINRIRSMVDSVHLQLDDADWFELLEASRGHEVA